MKIRLKSKVGCNEKKLLLKIEALNLVCLFFLMILVSPDWAWSQDTATVAPKRFVLAIQPTLISSEILEKAKPLEAALEQKLGGEVDVEIYAPMSYAAVIEALRFGHANAALMGAWPARLAVRLAEADLPLAEIREVIHGDQKVEANYYFSYWIVTKDSPYQKIEDLKGKNVCFSSPVSTSGYVAPLGKLVEMGIISKSEGKEADPKTFFGNVLFGGGYQQCWSALKSGQVDVSVIAGDVPETLYREVLEGSRVIGEQGPIPSHALVVSKNTEAQLRSKLIRAFIELGQENPDLMRSFISGIFVGFQETTAEEHLKGLEHYLELSGLYYTERLG
jgi:phosphonate transport system substrate-binding protein